MRPAAGEQWFTAAQYEVVADAGQLDGSGPPWIAHAKQMGTNLTACGQNAYTWSKLWHVPFHRASATRCPSCIDVTTSRAPRRDRPHA